MQAPNFPPSPDSLLSIIPPTHQGNRDTNNPSGSKNTVPGSAASASFGNLLKMQTLRPHLRLTRTEHCGAQQVTVMHTKV